MYPLLQKITAKLKLGSVQPGSSRPPQTSLVNPSKYRGPGGVSYVDVIPALDERLERSRLF